jgi:hypothetical protein
MLSHPEYTVVEEEPVKVSKTKVSKTQISEE